MLLFATSNAGKVEDAREILDRDVEQLDVETVEPCIDSLAEIAESKVRQAAEATGETRIIADDSGLFVHELDGFPGINTSFFDEKVGRERLLDLVEPGAAASFRAAIAFLDRGEVTVVEGEVSGTLVEPRGDGGFGYDPMFVPDGHDRTFAEDPDYKHEVSHRRRALEQLRDRLPNDS